MTLLGGMLALIALNLTFMVGFSLAFTVLGWLTDQED
jgi:hypothetical protein